MRPRARCFLPFTGADNVYRTTETKGQSVELKTPPAFPVRKAQNAGVRQKTNEGGNH